MQTINHDNPKVISTAADILQKGGMVVYPTETCYGLGVDATNSKAVTKLLKYKYRREGKPVSIAVSDKKMAGKYADINEIAANLYKNFLPGPLTVISKSRGNLAPGIESEYKTVGIRIPNHPTIIQVIQKLGKPVTATSANVSYKKHPYSIEALLKDLPHKQQKLIDLIIDAGKLPRKETSTVVDTTLNTLNILRKGQIIFDKKGKEVLSAVTENTEDTVNFGSMLILKYLNVLKDGVLVIALGGELGTGKTQFTKGIARQLGIEQTIKSPTFNLINEYHYKKDSISGSLIHADTWRLADEKELTTLNLENYIHLGNIIVVEWADKFYGNIKSLAADRKVTILKVRFEYLALSKRAISVEIVSKT